eukprot:g4543.t1
MDSVFQDVLQLGEYEEKGEECADFYVERHLADRCIARRQRGPPQPEQLLEGCTENLHAAAAARLILAKDETRIKKSELMDDQVRSSSRPHQRQIQKEVDTAIAAHTTNAGEGAAATPTSDQKASCLVEALRTSTANDSLVHVESAAALVLREVLERTCPNALTATLEDSLAARLQRLDTCFREDKSVRTTEDHCDHTAVSGSRLLLRCCTTEVASFPKQVLLKPNPEVSFPNRSKTVFAPKAKLTMGPRGCREKMLRDHHDHAAEHDDEMTRPGAAAASRGERETQTITMVKGPRARRSPGAFDGKRSRKMYFAKISPRDEAEDDRRGGLKEDQHDRRYHHDDPVPEGSRSGSAVAIKPRPRKASPRNNSPVGVLDHLASFVAYATPEEDDDEDLLRHCFRRILPPELLLQQKNLEAGLKRLAIEEKEVNLVSRRLRHVLTVLGKEAVRLGKKDLGSLAKVEELRTEVARGAKKIENQPGTGGGGGVRGAPTHQVDDGGKGKGIENKKPVLQVPTRLRKGMNKFPAPAPAQETHLPHINTIADKQGTLTTQSRSRTKDQETRVDRYAFLSLLFSLALIDVARLAEPGAVQFAELRDRLGMGLPGSPSASAARNKNVNRLVAELLCGQAAVGGFDVGRLPASHEEPDCRVEERGAAFEKYARRLLADLQLMPAAVEQQDAAAGRRRSSYEDEKPYYNYTHSSQSLPLDLTAETQQRLRSTYATYATTTSIEKNNLDLPAGASSSSSSASTGFSATRTVPILFFIDAETATAVKPDAATAAKPAAAPAAGQSSSSSSSHRRGCDEPDKEKEGTNTSTQSQAADRDRNIEQEREQVSLKIGNKYANKRLIAVSGLLWEAVAKAAKISVFAEGLGRLEAQRLERAVVESRGEGPVRDERDRLAGSRGVRGRSTSDLEDHELISEPDDDARSFLKQETALRDACIAWRQDFQEKGSRVVLKISRAGDKNSCVTTVETQVPPKNRSSAPSKAGASTSSTRPTFFGVSVSYAPAEPDDDPPVRLRVDAVDEWGCFGKILKAGDVILAVNGRDLEDCDCCAVVQHSEEFAAGRTGKEKDEDEPGTNFLCIDVASQILGPENPPEQVGVQLQLQRTLNTPCPPDSTAPFLDVERGLLFYVPASSLWLRSVRAAMLDGGSGSGQHSPSIGGVLPPLNTTTCPRTSPPTWMRLWEGPLHGYPHPLPPPRRNYPYLADIVQTVATTVGSRILQAKLREPGQYAAAMGALLSVGVVSDGGERQVEEAKVSEIDFGAEEREEDEQSKIAPAAGAAVARPLRGLLRGKKERFTERKDLLDLRGRLLLESFRKCKRNVLTADDPFDRLRSIRVVRGNCRKTKKLRLFVVLERDVEGRRIRCDGRKMEEVERLVGKLGLGAKDGVLKEAPGKNSSESVMRPLTLPELFLPGDDMLQEAGDEGGEADSQQFLQNIQPAAVDEHKDEEKPTLSLKRAADVVSFAAPNLPAAKKAKLEIDGAAPLPEVEDHDVKKVAYVLPPPSDQKGPKPEVRAVPVPSSAEREREQLRDKSLDGAGESSEHEQLLDGCRGQLGAQALVSKMLCLPGPPGAGPDEQQYFQLVDVHDDGARRFRQLWHRAAAVGLPGKRLTSALPDKAASAAALFSSKCKERVRSKQLEDLQRSLSERPALCSSKIQMQQEPPVSGGISTKLPANANGHDTVVSRIVGNAISMARITNQDAAAKQSSTAMQQLPQAAGPSELPQQPQQQHAAHSSLPPKKVELPPLITEEQLVSLHRKVVEFELSRGEKSSRVPFALHVKGEAEDRESFSAFYNQPGEAS